MRMLFSVLLGVTMLTAASIAKAAVPAPDASQVELVQPLPKPYDESLKAGEAVDQALARARLSGKRVLIEFGGNWCPDCRVLGAVLSSPRLTPFVDRYFEQVAVDVGRFDKNLDIPARFGIAKLTAVPTVLVLSPDGGVLNPDEILSLGDARTMTPQAIADWLSRWAKTPAKAG